MINRDEVSNEEYYAGQEPPYTTKSLSEDFERDFLKTNPNIVSFGGGNGVWKIKISGNFHQFKNEVFAYGKTRIYMHFGEIELISNGGIGTVLVSLLGC